MKDGARERVFTDLDPGYFWAWTEAGFPSGFDFMDPVSKNQPIS